MRVKTWGIANSKALVDLKFLGTYDFCGFQTQKSDFGGGVELAWQKGSSIQKSATPLDVADEWDSKEYAPLADIGSGKQGSLCFIVKMVEATNATDDKIDVKFIDEENEEKVIKVDVSFKHCLIEERVYVIHRALLCNDEAVVHSKGMLVPAPQSYMW